MAEVKKFLKKILEVFHKLCNIRYLWTSVMIYNGHVLCL